MATQKNGAEVAAAIDKENEIMEVDMTVKSLDDDDVDAIIEEDHTMRDGDLIVMDDGEEDEDEMEKYIEEDLDGATMNYDDLVVEDDGESLSNGPTVDSTVSTTAQSPQRREEKEEDAVATTTTTASDSGKPPSNGLASKEAANESNGYPAKHNQKKVQDEDDRPVSIPSDSDGEEEEQQPQQPQKVVQRPPPALKPQQQQQQKTPVAKQNGAGRGNCDTDEVHEILSDKEDCVMLEDTPPKARKNARAEDYDDDIQEIIDDPVAINATTTIQPVSKKMKTGAGSLPSGASLLASAHNQLAGLPADLSITAGATTKDGKFTYVDPKSLLNPKGGNSSSSNSQKTPLSNDVTTLLTGGGLTISHVTPGAGGMATTTTSPPTNNRATITPVGAVNLTTNSKGSSSSSSNPAASSPAPASAMGNILLPALTDDMFVLEAPSFIVPYIYEKPPSENLKQIVEEMKRELDALKVNDDKAEAKTVQDEEQPEKMAEEKEKDAEEGEEEGGKSKKNKKGKNAKGKSADDSWGESDESTDDDASDSETRTKVLIKEVDTKNIESMLLPGANKKLGVDGKPIVGGDNYFDSPLGQFFMSIGMSMVQEHVQSDLLRMQKRKQQREGPNGNPHLQTAIDNLTNNLQASRKDNAPFKFAAKRCDFCNFKSESGLSMASHYEKPHLKGNMYKCNFCEFEARPAHDILFHMEAVHNMKSKLEKPLSYHQCPNCPFEDNGKSKLMRHTLACAKKFMPEHNLLPPQDWDPPAKIPRVKPRHGLVGTATAYQAMAAQQQRLQAATGMLNKFNMPQGGGVNAGNLNQAALTASAALSLLGTNMAGLMNANVGAGGGGGGGGKSRNRNSQGKNSSRSGNNNNNMNQQNSVARTQQMANALLMQNNFNQLAAVAAAAAGKNFNSQQLLQMASQAMLPNANSSLTIQQSNPGSNKQSKNVQQPSISITPLPRQNSALGGGGGANSSPGGAKGGSNSGGGSGGGGNNAMNMQNMPKPGQHPSGNKSSFVICEICDGYIKDLDQLRSHMQLIHKVKIHPKMIYNRPPLNCQKCQYRFFTDQGLERHLLGSHGLVTSSMQEAANCGQDSGRCPICGRVYQWKLLNHVSRDHNMTLKPAHLSYKCTVCTATFGMYKQFENHVYSAHSTVTKKSGDKNKNSSSSASSSSGYGGGGSSSKSSAGGESLLKPLKINDEITIIPQPPAKMSKTQTIEIE